MISLIETLNQPKVYLNLHNLHPDTTDEEIREFYAPLNIGKMIALPHKYLRDLEFNNKEDAIKVVEKGTGEIRGKHFEIRNSIHHNNAFLQWFLIGYSNKKNPRKGYDQRDDRNYGQKDQSRNYNKNCIINREC